MGADELATELPSGLVAMGARSYVPQLGRFLQTDPIPGGSANAYAYVFGDPVDESDVTGDYVENNYSASVFAAEDQEAIEAEAAREQAAREAAEEAARIAAAVAAMDAKIAVEQAAINAQDLWDAESAEVFASYMANLPAQEAESAAAAAAEEGGGGRGRGGIVNPDLVDGISIRQVFCTGLIIAVVDAASQMRAI